MSHHGIGVATRLPILEVGSGCLRDQCFQTFVLGLGGEMLELLLGHRERRSQRS
jgi:hypothetical protein